MLTPLRKTILIFLLSLIAGIVVMPAEIPVKFSVYNINVDTVIKRPDLSINYKNIRISNELDLVLGLDLAGGSHIVFEADTSSLPQDRQSQAVESVKQVIERRVNLFGVSEPNVQLSSFEGKDRIIVELPGVRDTRQAIELIGKTAQLQFAEIGSEEEPDIIQTDLTGADLESAEVAFDPTSGQPVVSLTFNEDGTRKFAEITERNVGKPVVIMLDGAPISSPIVQEVITGGSAQISGDFSTETAKNLSIQLNAGALPVPVEVVEQRTVGATLGAESIQRSVRAGLIGVAMVFFFMILAYGRFGLIADMALIIFAILTLALYKLIPVVLTLPGVAGFLLSVGMAVDSNILIFERFKEEIRKRDFENALETAFGRAWDSIRDANIATLVTAFVLANPLDWNFLHTSGPVRGFAITLALGILISMFTGVVVSRNLMRVFVKTNEEHRT